MDSNQETNKMAFTDELLQKLSKFRREFYEDHKKQPERDIKKAIWNKIKKVHDLDKILTQMETSDELYPKFAAMKGYYLILVVIGVQKLFKTCRCDVPSYLTKCVKLLEPMKFRPEIIWLYNKCLFLYIVTPECLICSPRIKFLEKSKVACETYLHSTDKKAWDINDIFEHFDTDGNQVKVQSDNLRKHYFRVLEELLEAYIKTRNINSIFKYGLAGLKATLHRNNDPQLVSGKLLIVGSVFLDRGYLKQTNHFIALAMFKMVEYRRSLPEFRRSSCDFLQAAISLLFAKYGSYVLIFSLSKDENDFVKINEKFKRLEEPTGLELYENNISPEWSSDTKQLTTVHKKSMLWLERAIEMSRDVLDCTKRVEEIKQNLDISKFLITKKKALINKNIN